MTSHSNHRRIQSALLSVYSKQGLDALAISLHQAGVKIYSTGGTQKFLTSLGIPVIAVEDLTGSPEILGGRVKTLHPMVFGGILSRRDDVDDQNDMARMHIPEIDMVVVDLYPFEDTVASGASHDEIIEKIDIGGISLIRAAAKNYEYTTVISSQEQYAKVNQWLFEQDMSLDLEQRKQLAYEGFQRTMSYDREISQYLNPPSSGFFELSVAPAHPLRYGENPHQTATYYGDLDGLFTQLHGKELSYNNLADVDAAIGLCQEFSDPTVVIIKHTNSCGVASRSTLSQAWDEALSGDPVSAFGGVIAVNQPINKETAAKMNELFFEVLIAPAYEDAALELLKSKKNRVLLLQKRPAKNYIQYKSVLNGTLVQATDHISETEDQLESITIKSPSSQEMKDILFALRIVKHAKSNTIVLAKNQKLLGLGCGMTSRIDALQHAIRKAGEMGHSLTGAVMASDAFFPFPDCVEVANQAGITAVVQPGGSIRDQDSMDYCNAHGMAMVKTGIRHFRH